MTSDNQEKVQLSATAQMPAADLSLGSTLASGKKRGASSAVSEGMGEEKERIVF